MPAPVRVIQEEEYDNISSQLNDDESIADDVTVASNSFMAEDDRYDMSQPNTGHRKRKREQEQEDRLSQEHMLYSDSLLDYFMLSHGDNPPPKPEPPVNFNPDWLIDSDGHTAMHWAAAMGDIEVLRELKKHGANLSFANIRGETPLMRAMLFTNCQDKQTMPAVVKELIQTIEIVDFCRSSALHHAAAVTSSKVKLHCARYYIDIILNKLQEICPPEQLQTILDKQDIDGNTALHIAAKNGARKCVRALVGRGASTNIPNAEKVTADELIQELNENRKSDRYRQGSSSPYAPPESRYDMPLEPRSATLHHISEAAMSIQSKVTPMMIEKFHDLANSFDEELVEKERSEEEAKRILDTVRGELADVKEKIRNAACQQESPEDVAQGKQQLAQMETMFMSLVEQQQKMQLWSRLKHEESKTNGHKASVDDDIAERVMLTQLIKEQQTIRQQNVKKYTAGQSMAGGGEKEDLYRRLLVETLGTEADTMDQNLDILIEQLKEEDPRRQREVYNEA